MVKVRAPLLAVALLLPSIALADVKATVTDVIDGDTIRVVINVRVGGIDTPELKGKCPSERARARQARAFVQSHVGRRVVRLDRLSAGRYGRLVADVETEEGDLATLLLEAGLARKWRGKREDWCDE